MCSPYVNFFWASVTVSQEDTFSSSSSLESSVASQLLHVRSCAFVFNLSGLFLFRWDHCLMFPGPCPHTPSASPASTQPCWINKRALSVWLYVWKEVVVKRRVWLRWRWDWQGSVSNARRSRTHILRYKHTQAVHVWRNFTSESDSVTPRHRMCDLQWNTLCLLRHTHYMQTYTQLLCHHICRLHTHTHHCVPAWSSSLMKRTAIRLTE